ncbi:MAG: hypothetical protein ACI4I9_05155 [Porcipelethomonas sp.]
MTLILKLITSEGEMYPEKQCISFKLVREAYTPYSFFEGLFLSTWRELSAVKRIQFTSGFTTLHDGLADSVEVFRRNKLTYLRVKSRSFSSLLCQNQTVPGMRTNIAFTDLKREFSDIPNVYFEGTSRINYIYIKEGSTMWDAAVNFSFRMNGTYPYVTRVNLVRTTLKDPERHIVINGRNAVSTGVVYDKTKLLSDISMQDIDGNYDSFTIKNDRAYENEIVRKKQIPLDMQYLNDPQSALDYRIKYSERGIKCTYAEYVGYGFEELYDLMTIEGVLEEKRIHKMIVTGNGSLVKTYLGTYEDGFLQ